VALDAASPNPLSSVLSCEKAFKLRSRNQLTRKKIPIYFRLTIQNIN
jgi:hypothetical protein